MAELSTKPYLIRAIHEWCTDSGYRPHIAVVVDERTQVPREFVRNGEIVLNVSAMATNRLQISNELIEFEARFGGVARHVSVPIENVSAIYAQETGHGMAFEVPKALALVPEPQSSDLAGQEDSGSPHADDRAGGRGRGVDATGAGPAPGARRRPRLAAVPSGPPPAGDSSTASGSIASDEPAAASAAAKTLKRRRKDTGVESADAEAGRVGEGGERATAKATAKRGAADRSDAHRTEPGRDDSSPAGAERAKRSRRQPVPLAKEPESDASADTRPRDTRPRSAPRRSETGAPPSEGDHTPGDHAPSDHAPGDHSPGDDTPGDDTPPPAPSGRPRLTRVK